MKKGVGMAKKEPDRRNVHKPTLDTRLAKALNHSTRTQILAILNDRCASPSELAELLDIDLGNVSYHCKVLREQDCVEVVGKEQVRGAMKTYYRATTRMLLDTEDWGKLSKETRTGISLNAVAETVERASAALEAGTFDARTDRAVVNLKWDADQQMWDEAQSVLLDAYERLSEIEAGAANRKTPTGATFPMTISLLGYQSPPTTPSSDEAAPGGG